MHKHSFQSVSKHVHIVVIISEISDLYLKNYHIECTQPKIKYCPIEFDIDCMNEDTNYIYCTLLISSNPTDKNMIMHQVKQFKLKN